MGALQGFDRVLREVLVRVRINLGVHDYDMVWGCLRLQALRLYSLDFRAVVFRSVGRSATLT